MEHLDLIGRLTGGARGREHRAAIILLTNLLYVVGRVDVVDRWYRPVDPDQPAGLLVVDWPRVLDDVDAHAVPLSPGERAALRVAASMAVGAPADLRALFRNLDQYVAAAVIAALYTMSGRDVDLVNDHARLAGQVDR